MTPAELAVDSETANKEPEKPNTLTGGEQEPLEDPCRADAPGLSAPKLAHEEPAVAAPLPEFPSVWGQQSGSPRLGP